MISARTYFLTFIALLVLCFGLAARLAPQLQAMENAHPQSNNFFGMLLGDSRRLFANDLFVKADVYYHSGYYPTIFNNNQAFATPHIAADTGAVASHNQGEEKDFMGPPRDWLDAFGRHFVPDRHTHLDEGGPTDDLSKSDEVREILPWLKFSAELDPENVKTYVVTAFWLRTRLNQAGEAEQVLREGLRHNPNNPQLLFELGRIYFESYHNEDRARNIWEAALRSWAHEEPGVPQSERLKMTNKNFDGRFMFEQLQTSLANLEQAVGNYHAAIERWKEVGLATPDPVNVQRHINALKQLIAEQAPPTNSPAH